MTTGQVATTWDQATDLAQASRYDAWARPVAFTDQATANADGAPQPSTGNNTATSYDDAGRIQTTDDGVIRTQYTYDQPGDYRGLISELVYTRSSGAALYAAAASYDIDGQPDNAPIAPGLRLTERSDAAGNTTTRRYESDAGARLAAWTSLPSTAGQIRDLRRSGTQGAAAGQGLTDRRQTFGYDQADRLVRADDQTIASDGASTCTVRDYTYRSDGARTGSSSGTAGAMPGADTAAPCSGSVAGTASRAHSVNAWAQITTSTRTGANPGSGSYTYDPLGRVVGLPAVDSPAATPADTALGYYADGLPQSTAINGSTRTWTRDPAGRLAAWTDTTPGQPDTAATNHYDDPTSDSPAWTRNNDGTTTAWLTGPDGTLATTLTIAADNTLTGQGVLIDPLGTTTAIHPLATDPADTAWTPETLQPAADIDEYGVTLPGATTSTLTGGPGNTLGWHAQNQRPTDTTTALVTLGVRQYNPETGQFLSPDPIPGGNTTPYTHPQDPIDLTDLDGRQCYSNPNFARFCKPIAKRAEPRKHVVISFGGCLGVCVGATLQGLRPSVSLGAGAWARLGGSVGWANTSAARRANYATSAWGSYGVGAYYSHGLVPGRGNGKSYRPAHLKRGDWEVGLTFGVGGGWGVTRSWP